MAEPSNDVPSTVPGTAPGAAPEAPTRRSRTGSLKDKFLSVTSRVGTSISTLAMGTGKKPTSFAEKLSNVKRRVTQVTLEKFGSAKPSDDSEFQTYKTSLSRSEELIKNLRNHVNEFLNSVRAFSLASADVGQDVVSLFSGAGPAFEAPVTAYHTASGAVDNEMRRTLDVAMVGEVIQPLDEILRDISDLNKRITLRSRYKTDVDSHARNVRNLKTKGSTKPQKLLEKEQQYEEARTYLQRFDAELYGQIRTLAENRHSLCLPLIRRFRDLQLMFLQTSQTRFAGVPALPVRADPILSALPSYVPTTSGSGSGVSTSLFPPAPVSSGGAPTAAVGAPSAAMAPTPAGATAPAPAAAAPAAPAAAAPTSTTAVAMHAYEPRSSDELALAPGDVITVSRKEADGWWFGTTAGGSAGMFPSNFVSEQ